MIRRLFIYLLLVIAGYSASAQERLAPLGYNPRQAKKNTCSRVVSLKTTALNLPFFEDFTYYDNPDTNKWVDNKVFVNNNMCVSPVSWGAATFDGLNEYGLPYDPNAPTRLLYADSLTSRAIDLSVYQPGDSIYLSFFYQPQGNGFYPEAGDSLIVYLKRNVSPGAWIKAWSVAGGTIRPFRQVMIPVRAAEYFHNDFQFRFVNKASLNTNDDVWNVDYVRMDRARNVNDTLIADIAFSTEPSFMLNDYTYMPYHHFIANPPAELAVNHEATIHNNLVNPTSVNYGFVAREQVSGLPLANSAGNNINIAALTESKVNFPVYTNNVPATGGYQRVVYENKYILENTADEHKNNDTIIREQRFENYFAYDDGSAEKSYYLNLFATLPGKTAIEYHLNKQDTLLGVAIYFGRQVPLATNKDFSIVVYKDIAVNGGGDNIAYQQEFYFPGYLGTNEFYYYKFDSPVVLPSGTFYVGTVQPASGVSDSLYFGLDANRVGGNHLYYNVLGGWESSTLSGALMIRPIVGWIIPSAVPQVIAQPQKWDMYPNPANDHIILNFAFGEARYDITDQLGSTVLSGIASTGRPINIGDLMPGIYFVRLYGNNKIALPQKLIKL